MSGTRPEGFVVDLDVFAGPLDLLLDLAQRQKIDLGPISILRLAEQYLGYLERVRAEDLGVAAEYLVMAAWLAYLKSQLLLPPAERETPDPELLAEELAGRLRRLEAIRRGAAALAQRPALGSARLARGWPEPPDIVVEVERTAADLGGLLAAITGVVRRRGRVPMRVPAREIIAVESVLERLAQLLTGHDWCQLMAFLPPGLRSGVQHRSAIAASLVAGLELARTGSIELQQAAPFAPIMVRRR